MPSFIPYLIVWIVFTLWLTVEYLGLNGMLEMTSLLQPVLCALGLGCAPLDPKPGGDLSLILGWTGFALMVVMNLYTLRKKLPSMRKYGALGHWMNMHILFGLLGPTFIVFHCNFKVGGLVAISFWSMVISAVSGVIGRYFYLQSMRNRSELKESIDKAESILQAYLESKQGRLPPQAMQYALNQAFVMAGGVPKDQMAGVGVWSMMYRSMAGEVRMMLSLPKTSWPCSVATRKAIRHWALQRKRLMTMHVFKILLGYWKTFHAPFAIFMYLIAILHIISSLLFMVD